MVRLHNNPYAKISEINYFYITEVKWGNRHYKQLNSVIMFSSFVRNDIYSLHTTKMFLIKGINN